MVFDLGVPGLLQTKSMAALVAERVRMAMTGACSLDDPRMQMINGTNVVFGI